MLRCERETVINFDDASKTASISTSQEWMKRRLKKLAEKRPDDVRIKKEDEYTLFVELPAKWISIRTPRVMTEEQKASASERFKKYWEEKQKQQDSDNAEEDAEEYWDEEEEDEDGEAVDMEGDE